LSTDRITYVQSLRDLADTIEANPGLPLPGDTSVLPQRVGAPWRDVEDEQLVTELREGLSWEDIAATHHRKTGGVRSRAVRMQDPGPDTTANTLRDRLAADPAYDWRGPLGRSAARAPAATE
jgi:hypothetical protein